MAGKDLNQRVFDEQLRLMEQQSFFIIAATIAVVLLSMRALWSFLPHDLLILWGGLIGLLIMVRLGVLWCWNQKILQKHVAYHVIASGLSGLVWGGGGYFFLQQGSIEITIFVTLLVTSAVVTGIASLSTYAMAYYAFSIPAMTGISLHFFALPGINKYIGAACILFLIINMVFSREIQNILKKSIMLRFKNLDLINKLRLEKEIAVSAREEAVKNSRAKTRFLAAASHDLRQPLNAMGFFVEALQQEKDPGKSHELANKINASSGALRELLDSLLDISRIESGILRPEWEVFPIDRPLSLIADEYKLICMEKNIDFRYVPSSLWVKSDSHMLERMVRNIVENALQHSARSKILLGCRVRDAAVSVEIRDQGPGIPRQMQEKIFEEFYQLDNPERDRHKGLGLGLAVVNGLSRELGHDISVWSEPGKGVCFKIRLPTAAAKVTAVEVLQTSKTPPPDATILIVDDDAASLDAMAQMCCWWDYDILTASGLDQALELIAAGNRPDIIVTDYRLQKGMTGTEAIARIRRAMSPEITPGITPKTTKVCPAIIITGDTAPQRLNEAQTAGFPLLHKPVLPARLRTALQNIKPE